MASAIDCEFVFDTNYVYKGEGRRSLTNPKEFLMHGKGALIMYPYIFVGQFENHVPNGSGEMYEVEITRAGEIADFSKYKKSLEECKTMLNQPLTNIPNIKLIHSGTWKKGVCQR